MALTFPLPEIAESRQLNGVGNQSACYLVIPGTSDYTTGGYAITAAQCRMTRIISVSIDGINATGNAIGTGYSWTSIVNYTLSSANNIGLVPTSFLLFAETVTAGAFAQAANGFNFAGLILGITVTGY